MCAFRDQDAFTATVSINLNAYAKNDGAEACAVTVSYLLSPMLVIVDENGHPFRLGLLPS